MSRTGKIARLPRPLRDELNHRLDQGHSGQSLVQWLNSLPEVHEILLLHFEGKPIREQNLSEWRKGGFAEWQALRDLLDEARSATESSEDLAATCGPLADHAARLLSARLAVAISKWNGDPCDPTLTRLRNLIPLINALATLRRGDHSAARLPSRAAHRTVDCAQPAAAVVSGSLLPGSSPRPLPSPPPTAAPSSTPSIPPGSGRIKPERPASSSRRRVPRKSKNRKPKNPPLPAAASTSLPLRPATPSDPLSSTPPISPAIVPPAIVTPGHVTPPAIPLPPAPPLPDPLDEPAWRIKLPVKVIPPWEQPGYVPDPPRPLLSRMPYKI